MLSPTRLVMVWSLIAVVVAVVVALGWIDIVATSTSAAVTPTEIAGGLAIVVIFAVVARGSFARALSPSSYHCDSALLIGAVLAFPVPVALATTALVAVVSGWMPGRAA